MTEDCEYYKPEKGRLLEALKEMPGWERHLPRSPSPRSKCRSKSAQCASSGTLSPTSPGRRGGEKR
jgi:hypothetical protein